MGYPKRQSVKIESVEKDVLLDVWFYHPESPGPWPVVIAGHGITLVKEAGLAVFGEHWASDAGYASLILDYRGFGQSDGEPRNLVSLKKQMQDYESVLKWVRHQPERFRTDKIVLMGSALSSLVVSKLLIEDSGIAGGMVHGPVLDGRATLLAGPVKPRLMLWAIIDTLRGSLGMQPSFIRAIGRPDEFAMLNTPSCHEGFKLCYAKGPRSFEEAPNLIAPRVVFELMSSEWRPGTQLRHAQAPLLVVAPTDDDLIPFSITEDLAKQAGDKVRLAKFEGGHFDVMSGGAGFNFNVKAQVDFLRDILKGTV